MSRTYRVKRPQMRVEPLSNGKVKDGTPTHSSASCRHHGGCAWCTGNRTIAAKRARSYGEVVE